MKFEINNETYEVIIEYKNNKNMYLRVKKDLKIYITAPKNTKDKTIKDFINKNILAIEKIINDQKKKIETLNNKILYLGKTYDISYIENNKIIFANNKVFVSKNFKIDNFYKKEAQNIFKEHLDYCYNLFRENIPYPNLKIRKMTSKWGVCNISKKTITLNLELIKLDLKYLDYVIIHELSHFIYPNHSQQFWSLVSKYEPLYKQYRKEMKNVI